MSIKYKDSNGTIEDVAGGLTADMAQTMIDESVMPLFNGWDLTITNPTYSHEFTIAPSTTYAAETYTLGTFTVPKDGYYKIHLYCNSQYLNVVALDVLVSITIDNVEYQLSRVNTANTWSVDHDQVIYRLKAGTVVDCKLVRGAFTTTASQGTRGGFGQVEIRRFKDGE